MPTLTVRELIEAEKLATENEILANSPTKPGDVQKIELFKRMYRHGLGLFFAWVELQLGYKPNLRE